MTETNQHAEAIEALAPETREITGAGKTYTVRRLETRQIWPTLRAGLPILDGLSRMVAKPSSSSPAGAAPQAASGQPGQSVGSSEPRLAGIIGPEAAVFLETMAEHGERINDIIAIALDCTVRDVGKFEVHETYLALKAIIEVNRDFFTNRVAPLLGLQPGGLERSALAGAVQQALGVSFGGGPTPSNS